MITKKRKNVQSISNEIYRIPKLSKYAQIADLMRLEIINTHGGIYFDTNFEIKENKFQETVI